MQMGLAGGLAATLRAGAAAAAWLCGLCFACFLYYAGSTHYQALGGVLPALDFPPLDGKPGLPLAECLMLGEQLLPPCQLTMLTNQLLTSLLPAGSTALAILCLWGGVLVALLIALAARRLPPARPPVEPARGGVAQQVCNPACMHLHAACTLCSSHLTEWATCNDVLLGNRGCPRIMHACM